MQNDLNFNIKFKENLTGKMSNNLQGAMGKFGSSVDLAGKKLDDLGKAGRSLGNAFGVGTKSAVDSINEISHALKNANRELQSFHSAAGKGGSGGRGGSFLSMAGAMGVGNLAAGAVMGAGRFAIDQGKSVISAGLDASKNRSQFNVLAGQDGSKLYGDLSKYIQDSVFGPELFDGAKMLLSYGQSAKDILPNLKMLGDIAGGDAEKMKSLTYAFAQTTTAGKLVGNDLMQYTAAGFNPLEVISKHTGRSMAGLTNDKEAGKISAAMVKQAMLWDTQKGGRHFGMLDAMNNSAFGKTQALSGNIDMAKMSLGESLLPAYTRILDKLQPIVEALPSALDKLVPFGERLAGAFGETLPNMMRMMGGIGSALKPLGDALTSQPMKDFGKNILDLGGAIAVGLTPAVKRMAEAAETIARGANILGSLIPGHKNTSLDGLPQWGGQLRASRQINHLFQHSEREQLKEYMQSRYGGQLEGWMNNPAELDYFRKHKRFIEDKGMINPQSMMGISLMGIGYGVNNKMYNSMMSYKGNDLLGTGGKKGQKNEEYQAANEVSDSIVGGGKRAVYFNFKNVVETINNNPNSKGEAISMMANDLEMVLARFAAATADMG